MGRRRLDDIRGSWLVLVVLLCIGAILGFGLGSERVRTIARGVMPSVFGGGTQRDGSYWKESDEDAAKKEEEAAKTEEEALPDLPEKESFRGVVKDEAGTPLKGAVVEAQRWRENRWENLGTARTDGQGRFVLGPLPRANLSVLARAEGFASQRKAARTGATLEFTLKSGGSLAGKIVDARTGAPVPGCSLRGWSQNGNWYESTESGEDGVFRFLSVPPGRVWLEVQPKVHRPTSLGDVEVREEEETFKEIPVVAGGTLTGKVLDRDTGVPVAGALIRTWEGKKECTSAEDGTYVLAGPPQGGVSLRVSAEAYPEQWQWIQVTGDPEGETKQDLKIGKGGRVSGQVLGPDGEPVPGARVGRDPGSLMTGVPENVAVADAEGNWSLEAVPSMTGGRLFAIADDFALTRSDPVTVRPGTDTAGIVIRLQTGATFKGKVVDEEGEPLPGVAFSLQRQWSPSDGGWFWIPGLVGYSVADGTWEIAQVPEGTYNLSLALEGYAPEGRRPIMASTSGEVPGLDFVLRKGTVITGWVRSLAGEPVAGASVNAWGWVRQSDGTQSWAQRSDVRTNDEGYFVLDGLQEGSYQININATGFSGEGMGGIAAGMRDLQITLQPTARIEGRVVEVDGVTPVPTFTLKVVQEMDEEGNRAEGENILNEQEFADREGKFVLQDLSRGQVAVYAVSGNRISRRREGIFVTPGAVVDGIVLTVSEGGRLRVRLRDPGGSPVERGNVSAGVRQPDGSVNYQFWAQTNAEGEAVFTALPDGVYDLYGNYGENSAQRSVTVAPGGETDVDLTLRVGAAVLARVRNPEGGPVADAVVSFQVQENGDVIHLNWSKLWNRARATGRAVDWQQVQRDPTRTNVLGELLRESLPEGTVWMTVHAEGFLPYGGTVRTLDGFQVEAAVTLQRTPVADPGGTADGEGEGE